MSVYLSSSLIAILQLAKLRSSPDNVCIPCRDIVPDKGFL